MSRNTDHTRLIRIKARPCVALIIPRSSKLADVIALWFNRWQSMARAIGGFVTVLTVDYRDDVKNLPIIR